MRYCRGGGGHEQAFAFRSEFPGRIHTKHTCIDHYRAQDGLSLLQPTIALNRVHHQSVLHKGCTHVQTACIIIRACIEAAITASLNPPSPAPAAWPLVRLHV